MRDKNQYNIFLSRVGFMTVISFHIQLIISNKIWLKENKGMTGVCYHY